MSPKRKRTDDKNQFSAAATATNDYDDDDIRSLLISLNEKVQEMKNEQKEIREEMKQAFVHRSETKEEFKEMRERMNAIKDTVERIDSVVSPSPLWKFVTDHPDVFEKHVLLSGYLNGSDIKMFYGSCRASRSAVKRAKIELQQRFRVRELSSISTMELAWEGYPWGETARSPDGKEFTQDQEFFCAKVARTNDLKLLRWVREEKECDWNHITSGEAASYGNLDMLKYCVENGCKVDARHCATAAQFGHLDCLKYLRSKNCPWDEQVCDQAHENSHMDILTYAVKNKCPGFEAYEQFVQK